MSKILVCGLVNVETTVKVSQFPVEYCPIDYNFFGINCHPAGVGLNLSFALNSLSDEVRLLSMVSDDSSGQIVRNIIKQNGISTKYLQNATSTAQSVVLYDNDGKRRIFCDLKDFQDKSYDEDIFKQAASDCDVLCLCNINFSRNLLSIAKQMNKCIACDVHVLSDVFDSYNKDYINAADILFLSNENILGKENEFVNKLKANYDNKIIVCSMGSKGALMYVKDEDKFYTQKAYTVSQVVNTVGAGDALFSAFVHFYAQGIKPDICLRYACAFASNKIGFDGAAKGFLDEKSLLDLVKTLE